LHAERVLLIAENVKIVILMGVSGSGKTTIAVRLAAELGWPYLDADVLHPSANTDKMRAGIPLTDTDRKPWLEAILARIEEVRGRGGGLIVACSALRRSYRDLLTRGRPDTQLVYLKGSAEIIHQRLIARTDHFAGAELLASQLQELEEPGPEECAIIMDVTTPPDAIVEGILARLRG
jgi:gluconokinase